MLDLDKIQGIIFDYGATIDSNGKHWAWVIWDAYQTHQVPIARDQFKEAYVYAERYLATNRVVLADDNFLILMQKKIKLQFEYLVAQKIMEADSPKIDAYIIEISQQCYTFAQNIISREVSLLTSLQEKYPMVLVSNFYGNVEAVLKDFNLLDFFNDIIESAVVGVRKPNPAIFGLGIDALGIPAPNIVVIGDSYLKDIVPASENGCQTIWLKGPGWEDKSDEGAQAGAIIYDFMELKTIFDL